MSPVVHREDEWKLVEAEIKRRQNGPVLPNSITAFFGTAGIGKTTFILGTLVPRIQDYFPGSPLALIDFDKDRSEVDKRYDEPHGRGHILLDLLTQLENHSDRFVPGLAKVRRSWGAAFTAVQQQPETADSDLSGSLAEMIENLTTLFSEYVASLVLERERRPVIFIVDTAEEVSRELMGWIKGSLQTPTTDTGYVLWVMAGRQPVDCQPFFLRPRYQWHLLKPFEDKQIQKQVPDRADLAPVFKHFSYGLPEATSKLADTIFRIEQEEQRTLGPVELEEKHTNELILSLSDLLGYERYLGRLELSLRIGLRFLSPLRLFNVTIVAQLLPEMSSEHFKRATIGAEALYVIQQMVRTKLVSWDRERRGYVIEEPIRKIVSLVLEHSQPDDYATIHQWAEKSYGEWAKNVEAKRLDYIIEALYHKTIILIRLEKAPDVVTQLAARLEQMVQEYYVREAGRDEEAIDELKQQLVSDQDFVELLRPEGVKQLVKALQR